MNAVRSFWCDLFQAVSAQQEPGAKESQKKFYSSNSFEALEEV